MANSLGSYWTEYGVAVFMQGDQTAALVLKLRAEILDVRAVHWLSACRHCLSLQHQQADNSWPLLMLISASRTSY